MGNESEGQGTQTSVTITDNGDGTYAVSMNQDDGNPSQESGQTDNDQPQQADSLEDALKIAAEMLSSEAEEADQGGDNNAPMPSDDAQSYWNQMASKQKAKVQ